MRDRLAAAQLELASGAPGRLCAGAIVDSLQFRSRPSQTLAGWDELILAAIQDRSLGRRGHLCLSGGLTFGFNRLAHFLGAR